MRKRFNLIYGLKPPTRLTFETLQGQANPHTLMVFFFAATFGGFVDRRWPLGKQSSQSYLIRSGQIIATSHDLTPNGGLVREIPLFQGNLGWWNIVDGRNLAPVEIHKSLVKNGMKYQPQLVSLPDFWTINCIVSNRRSTFTCLNLHHLREVHFSGFNSWGCGTPSIHGHEHGLFHGGNPHHV